MTTAVTELYDALRKAGVDEQSAMAAARAVMADQRDLITKADLQAALADLEAKMARMQADIIKWNVGTILAMTGIFAAIVKIF